MLPVIHGGFQLSESTRFIAASSLRGSSGRVACCSALFCRLLARCGG
jgi:hypothetical protein